MVEVGVKSILEASLEETATDLGADQLVSQNESRDGLELFHTGAIWLAEHIAEATRNALLVSCSTDV